MKKLLLYSFLLLSLVGVIIADYFYDSYSDRPRKPRIDLKIREKSNFEAIKVDDILIIRKDTIGHPVVDLFKVLEIQKGQAVKVLNASFHLNKDLKNSKNEKERKIARNHLAITLIDTKSLETKDIFYPMRLDGEIGSVRGLTYRLYKEKDKYFKNEPKVLTKNYFKNLERDKHFYQIYWRVIIPSKVNIFSRIGTLTTTVIWGRSREIAILLVFLIIWLADSLHHRISLYLKWDKNKVLLLFLLLANILYEGLQHYGYNVFLVSQSVPTANFWLIVLSRLCSIYIPIYLTFQWLSKKCLSYPFLFFRWFRTEFFIVQELIKAILLFLAGVIITFLVYFLTGQIGCLLKIPSIQFIQENYFFNGNFLYHIRYTWGIIVVGNFLNNLRKHLDLLSLQASQVKISKKTALASQSEFDALQARVNPHFLYNSLNSLASLAILDPKKTEQMALALSNFYKKSTNRQNKQFSTLRAEKDLLKTYLDIEKIRFADKLVYELDFAAACLDIQIPHFLLQPIVENAIKYGFNTQSNQIYIKIKVRLEQGQLNIQVFDKGRPFPENLSSGYGLRSVQKKLKLLYPEQHQLSFINEPVKQVQIIMTVLSR